MRTVYAIRNTAGELIAEHVRVDWPGGRKRMYWQMPGCNARDGLHGVSTPDLPLYGSEYLHRLNVGQAVVICEGERATEALWSLDIPALGTVTGSSSTPGEDALAVLLPFDVVLWPDHDRPGYAHMNRVAWELHRLGGHLPRVIGPVPAPTALLPVHAIVPYGFDAADVVGDEATIRRLIDAAHPWDLHADVPKPARPARPAYDRVESEQRIDTARAQLLHVVEGRLGPPHEMRARTPWWRCPFHTEQGPSFKVDLREPFFRCFGCGARGDVFEFLKRMEGVEFKDALRELAPPRELGGLPRIWS